MALPQPQPASTRSISFLFMPIEPRTALGCLLVPTVAEPAPPGACVCGGRCLRPCSLCPIQNLPLPPLPGLLSFLPPSARRARPAHSLLAAALPSWPRAPRCLLGCLRLPSSLPRALSLSPSSLWRPYFFLFIVSMVTSLAPLSTRRPRDPSVSRGASRDLPTIVAVGVTFLPLSSSPAEPRLLRGRCPCDPPPGCGHRCPQSPP